MTNVSYDWSPVGHILSHDGYVLIISFSYLSIALCLVGRYTWWMTHENEGPTWKSAWQGRNRCSSLSGNCWPTPSKKQKRHHQLLLLVSVYFQITAVSLVINGCCCWSKHRDQSMYVWLVVFMAFLFLFQGNSFATLHVFVSYPSSHQFWSVNCQVNAYWSQDFKWYIHYLTLSLMYIAFMEGRHHNLFTEWIGWSNSGCSQCIPYLMDQTPKNWYSM